MPFLRPILLYLPLLLSLSKTCFAQDKNPTRAIESYLDLVFTPAEQDSFQSNLEDYRKYYQAIHRYALPNPTAPTLLFNPLPENFILPTKQDNINWGLPKKITRPKNIEDLAFSPVYELATLIRTRQITSLELTQLYLNRLKKYGDTLQCVITLLEENALTQARKADLEIDGGNYKGPLHGIPFGIKDLLAVKGTKTTWGAGPYQNQVIDETATVVTKLEEAGAILLAKLTLGALASGDIWYGGRTRNPWDLTQGSSGSSAGSSAATAAGLVAFSLGTETWGSIVSPSTRCGATGLRPTYGAVSRMGAMTLSWSMDKIGPICRSALDCALVFDAIRGPDGKDKTVVSVPFNYKAHQDLKKLKVGYVASYFKNDYPNRKQDSISLEVFKKAGIDLHPISLPDSLPIRALSIMLSAEAAAAFDELTRSDRDSLLVNQRKNAWPTRFRSARFIPAVEYINASRIRKDLIEQFDKCIKGYDIVITPSYGGEQLLMTNLTGHPCLVVPNGFNEKGNPVSLTFLGQLHGEASLITIGRFFQEKTDWENRHPPLFK